MANFLDKIRINKATEHFSTFNLDCSHITTQDFFKIKPVYIRPLVPGQSIDVNLSSITRLDPLFKPMYGNVNIINRAFFVPFRLLMQGFNEFITDTPYYSGSAAIQLTTLPFVKMSTLLQTFISSDFSTETTSSSYDIYDVVNNKYYTLNSKGRYAYDILMTLGYQIDGRAYTADAGYEVKLNAMPIIALVKIYIDWFENTNFAPNGTLRNVLQGLNREISIGDMKSIFNNILYCSYENDYFTSSWTNPTSPYVSVHSSPKISDPTLGMSEVTLLDGVPDLHRVDNSTLAGPLSQYILTALHSLTDYMKRHQLSGYRALDRFYSRFGMKLKGETLNRSSYLGKSVTPINITDVTSTADTDGAVLGQYSGFGIAKESNGHFSYNAEDEYGYFIILSVISPSQQQYRNGIDRHLLDLDKLDLYTPEFDGLGCQAIANCEVKADYNMSDSVLPNSVWAYIPRYGHLKVANDRLSGDFRIRTGATSLESFHLFRNFDTLPKHDLSFCTGDNKPYDRIFNSNDTESIQFDHFNTIFHFKVKSKAPMSPLFENYHFDEEGNAIEMKVGGTKLS